MKIKDLKFDSAVDMAICLEDEEILKSFLKCLAEVCCEVYENSSEEVSGILLEQSKKKFYNIDVAIVVKALTTSIKNIVEDENKKAKIEYFFHSQNKQKTKNLRFIINYLSYKNVCSTPDKKYLYVAAVYENKTKEKFFALTSLGFNKETVENIIDDIDMSEIIKDIANVGSDEIELLGYGKKAKDKLEEREISMFHVIEIKSMLSKAKDNNK